LFLSEAIEPIKRRREHGIFWMARFSSRRTREAGDHRGPYGPEWFLATSQDIAVSMKESGTESGRLLQPGATGAALSLREEDGKGPKRCEVPMAAGASARSGSRTCSAVGGSIFICAGDRNARGQVLSYDTRHMLAELQAEAGPGDSYGQPVSMNVV